MNNIKELNVLVLSMSTLPWNGLSSSKYYGMYNNKKISGNYVGQLEAGTKFLIRVLKENNKKFDKIVILNTGKTIEEERESESKPFSKYINVEDRDTDLFSADSFFKKRINKYLKTYEELYIDAGYQDNIDELFLSIMLESKQANGEYVPDDMAAFKICEQIMGLAEKDQKINIYLNMQGGIRTTIFIIKAALDLLRERNVEIKEQVEVAYNKVDSTDNDNAYEVKFVAGEYLITDLVAGMRAFISYGRADELIYYLNKRKVNKKRNNNDKNYENELVNIIREIAESIQISDPIGFNSALNRFKTDTSLLDKENYHDVYFKIAVDDIKSAYDPLLSDDATTIDTIKWFCDRGFIAQSLTFIEDKMPELYINNKIIDINSPKTNKELLDALGAPGYDSRVPNAIINSLSTKLRNSINKDYMIQVMKKCVNHYVDKNIQRIRPTKHLTSGLAVRSMFVSRYDDFNLTSLIEMVDIERVMRTCRVSRNSNYFSEEEVKDFLDVLMEVKVEEDYTLNQKLIKNHKRCLEAVDDNEKFINFIKAYERFRARDYVRCNEHIKYFKECMIAELKKHISEDGLRLRKGQIEDDIEIYSQYILECFKSLNFDDSFKENLKHMYFGDVNSQENPNLYAYEIWKSMLILYVNDTKGIQIDVDKILEDNYLTDDNRQNSLLSEIINQLDSMSDDEFYEKFLEFSYNNNALQKNKSKISRDISYCNADFYFKYCGDDIAQLYMNNDKYLSVENGYMYETMAGVRCDNNVMLNYVDSLKIHNNIDSIKLEKILRLHSVLKQERNNTNHASEKCIRLPLAVINKAINLYVKWVKEIINLI